MATIENLPFFNLFFIDYVRWESQNNHPGASTVDVQGRELIVNGAPFTVKGIAYNPISIGEDWRGAWTDRADRYLVDFPLIAASGANTVRVYAPLLSTAMLDAAWANGLFVMPTFGVDVNQLGCAAGKAFMQDRFLEMVNAWKDHPAVLLWLIGNEFNTSSGLTNGELCTEWYPQLDAMAAAAHAAEGANFHPVATANADTANIGDVCQAACSQDTDLPNLDIWALQAYRGCSFQGLFSQYAAKSDCDKPLLITEFGVDAYDSLLPGESEALQASCLDDLLEEADAALAVRTPGGVSAGQVIFEWADEWWKGECAGSDWATHDDCTAYSNPAFPDPAVNEEWWGLVSIDAVDPDARTTRTSYDRTSETYQLGAVCNHSVESHDSGTGATTISFDPAAGSTDHVLYYGPLSAVSTYGYSDSVAGLGASGSSSFTLPAGSLFWVVAPKDNVAEGCYGTDSTGAERPCFPNGTCAVAEDAFRNCECL
jgi:hypothetical protein